MIDRDRHVGVDSEPRLVTIEAGFLKFFAKATGETDPAYFDETAALAAGHPSIPAPPTYLFSLAMAAPAKRGGLFDKEHGLGIDMARILHGEQQFTYHQPVYAGETLTLTTRTSDIYEKKGGALVFIVQDTKATDEAGAIRVDMRVVTVIRND